MEPDKSIKDLEDKVESYTPAQMFLLKIMKLVAWTASFVAMMYAMHS